MDKVSVIMPAYNAEDYIIESIESVLNQSYKILELIIVNDNSNDRTEELINKYSCIDNRVIHIKCEENKGVSNARNIGLQNASGDFIAFLDSDDIWDVNKIATQLKYMKEKKCIFSCSAYQTVNEKGNMLNKEFYPPSKTNYFKLLKGNTIGCLTVMIQSSYMKYLQFPNIGHEDYAAWLSFLKKTEANVYGIQKSLSYYRIRQNSVSSNKFKAAIWTWSIYRKFLKIDFFKSFYYMINYVYNSLRKYNRKN